MARSADGLRQTATVRIENHIVPAAAAISTAGSSEAFTVNLYHHFKKNADPDTSYTPIHRHDIHSYQQYVRTRTQFAIGHWSKVFSSMVLDICLKLTAA